MIFINVDLPEPLAPMMATNSPGWIVGETPRGAHIHLAGVIGLLDLVELNDSVHPDYRRGEAAAAERIVHRRIWCRCWSCSPPPVA